MLVEEVHTKLVCLTWLFFVANNFLRFCNEFFCCVFSPACRCPSCEILFNDAACPRTGNGVTFYPLRTYTSQIAGTRCCGSFESNAEAECKNGNGWEYKGFESLL